jgi:chromosome segregation ATPase
MSAREEILDRMKKGATWDELEDERKRSKSAFYKAVQEYLYEKEIEFRALRQNILAGEETLRELEDKQIHLINVVTTRENELKDVTNDLEKIILKISEKNKELEESQAKLDATLRQLRELKERGVSEPTLQTLNNMDYGSEEELLARMGTMGNYLQFSEELEHLRSKVETVRSEVNQLGDQKTSLEREINNLTTQLDSKLKENSSYDAHISTVKQFVADGYTLDDIGAFIEALRSLRR